MRGCSFLDSTGVEVNCTTEVSRVEDSAVVERDSAAVGLIWNNRPPSRADTPSRRTATTQPQDSPEAEP